MTKNIYKLYIGGGWPFLADHVRKECLTYLYGFFGQDSSLFTKRPDDLASFASLAMSCGMLIQLSHYCLAPVASLTGEIIMAKPHIVEN